MKKPLNDRDVPKNRRVAVWQLHAPVRTLFEKATTDVTFALQGDGMTLQVDRSISGLKPIFSHG